MRRIQVLLLVLVGMVLSACDSSEPDDDSFTGRYELQTVQGQAVPVVLVEFEQDKVEVTAGHLDVNPDDTFSASLTLRTTEGGEVTTETSTADGTYTRNEDVFRFVYADGSSDTGTLVDSTLTVTSQGMTLVFRK